jgi:arabinose-5-phosphate isomerase
MPHTNKTDPVRRAKEVFELETEALRQVAEKLGESFERAIHLLENCKGMVFIAGVGKSGLVGRKIAATLASTGTPSAFIHPVEGAHGDLGMIRDQDMVLVLSKSGETEELFPLVTMVRSRGIPLVGVLGDPDSTLGKASEVVLHVQVGREACPLGLAPTSSTTAMLCLGDALAIVLLERRGFREEQFARFHPRGLARSVLLKAMRVHELMRAGQENPVAQVGRTVREILPVLNMRLGLVSVVEENGRLCGIITDGDLKRGLQEFDADYLDRRIEEVMTRAPVTIAADDLVAKAFDLFENRPTQIHVLPVVDAEKRPVGVLRLHDLVKAGLR